MFEQVNCYSQPNNWDKLSSSIIVTLPLQYLHDALSFIILCSMVFLIKYLLFCITLVWFIWIIFPSIIACMTSFTLCVTITDVVQTQSKILFQPRFLIITRAFIPRWLTLLSICWKFLDFFIPRHSFSLQKMILFSLRIAHFTTITFIEETLVMIQYLVVQISDLGIYFLSRSLISMRQRTRDLMTFNKMTLGYEFI